MQTRTYRRLREEDRHIIYRMSKAGNTQCQIAQAIGVSQSTVSKEMPVIVAVEAIDPSRHTVKPVSGNF